MIDWLLIMSINFERFLHPKDGILDTGENTVLIVGIGAYKALIDHVLGIEINEDRAEVLRSQGYNVEVARKEIFRLMK